MSKPVVYIDDEPALCRIVKLRLESMGVPVEAFTDPDEALAWVCGHDVRAVLCDYRMPTLTGIEVLDRLPPGMPFYVVSGEIAIDEELAGDPRVSGVIPKPIPFDEIVVCLGGGS